MPAIARAVICALAFGQWEVANALRARRKTKSQQVATETAATSSCASNNFLAGIVRSTVNGALNLALRGLDPANISFHAGKHEIDLRLCRVGLEIDATLAIAGFQGAHIDELACVEETCVEEGRWGCAVTQYTFDSTVKFGETILVNGETVADWNLCGLNSPNRTNSIGVDSVGPGTRATFIIQRAGLAGYSIKNVTGLDSTWGTLQNFRCGFSSLPSFIGSRLESWCENIIEFVADKSEGFLQEHIDALLLSLINRVLDSPEEESGSEVANTFGATHETKGQLVATETAVSSCASNNFLAGIVRSTVNGALNLALRGLDPANVSFHAGKHEIDLRLCRVGLEIDATLAIAGFQGAHIDELACVEETCVEEGRWGCAVTQYTFDSTVKFGEMILVDGETVADWNLCGLNSPNRTNSIGVDSVGPGTRATFIIQRAGLAGYSIKNVTGLDSTWGTLQNFRCGFSSLPSFIGSMLESWCENIIEFVADKSEGFLQEHIDALLLSLINRVLDSPEEESG